MSFLLRLIATCCLFAATAVHGASTSKPTCMGKFPNPITDICWSCILPIKIGDATIANYGGQEDSGDNPSNPLCSCIVNPVVGLNVGFWEPARHVEVVKRAWCLPTLGGLDLDPGIDAPEGASATKGPQGRKAAGTPFYQAHYYVNPALYWLGVVTDWPCLEHGSYDLAYMTEVDPLWSDDELSLLLNPEAVLFANPIAIIACAADCVAASVDFGIREMFWCAGCEGGIYPFTGWLGHYQGGVRIASLIAQRLTAKLHRELIAWGWHGTRGQCGPYFLPMMDKLAYKSQLMYPIPAGAVNGTSCQAGDSYSGGNCLRTDGSTYSPTAILGEGRCCAPFGRTTIISGAGREYPVRGEDFAYMLFRKRTCCVGY
jgi:conjugal transfer pilus assembly protein TraU